MFKGNNTLGGILSQSQDRLRNQKAIYRGPAADIGDRQRFHQQALINSKPYIQSTDYIKIADDLKKEGKITLKELNNHYKSRKLKQMLMK